MILQIAGYGQCPPGSISISQSSTGAGIETKLEWKVIINNDSPCIISDLKLDCAGFQTVKRVDPSILSKSGSVCLVNSGGPINPHAKLSFTYAWENSFPFKELYCQSACS